jgi:hypothetical protein
VPFSTSCYSCVSMTFPQGGQSTAHCTLANRPRTQAHCVEWLKHIETDKLGLLRELFGEEFQGFDTDQPLHLAFLHHASQLRAQQFRIQTNWTQYETLGWFKNPLPALGTTNAIISAIISNEAFKFVLFYTIFHFLRFLIADKTRKTLFLTTTDKRAFS